MVDYSGIGFLNTKELTHYVIPTYPAPPDGYGGLWACRHGVGEGLGTFGSAGGAGGGGWVAGLTQGLLTYAKQSLVCCQFLLI